MIERPAKFDRVVIGVDCAYTIGAGSDWSAAVVLGSLRDLIFVIEVMREREETDVIADKLLDLRASYPGAAMASYVSGPEIGVYKLLLTHWGIPVMMLPARYNKIVRSKRTQIAWKQGRILLPRYAPWLGAFLQELRFFNGAEGQQDDQVDALVSGFDILDTACPASKGGASGAATRQRARMPLPLGFGNNKR